MLPRPADPTNTNPAFWPYPCATIVDTRVRLMTRNEPIGNLWLPMTSYAEPPLLPFSVSVRQYVPLLCCERVTVTGQLPL